MEFSDNRTRSPHATRLKHGGCGTRLYTIWLGMKTRTTNPKAINYNLYGGKNIKVCDEWKQFESFREWSLSNGYSDKLSIDRIDGDSDYCPENCRWVTMKEQQNNRCSNHLITFNGETKTMTQWAESMNISPKTMFRRIVDKKWPIEKALTTPLQTEYRRRVSSYGKGAKK